MGNRILVSCKDLEKIVFGIILLFSFAEGTFAQWSVGGKVGANFSNLKNGSMAESMTQRVGFNLGAVGHYQFNDWLGIQGEILYAKYAVLYNGSLLDMGNVEGNGNLSYIHDPKIRSHYIDVPILAQISPFKRIPGVSFEVGVQPGFFLGENIKDGKRSVDTNLYDRNPVNCSLLFGAAFKFPANWYFDLRYVLGITDNYESYHGINTRALQLSLGYLFQL